MASPVTAPVCVTTVSTLPKEVVWTNVLRVKDGDTFVVEKNVCTDLGFKLAGQMECVVRSRAINTTELAHGGKGEEEGAQSAGDFLTALILGKRVALTKPQGQDAYHRMLVDETYVSAADASGTYIKAHASLVEQGLAHLFVFEKSQEAVRLALLACEEGARQVKRGIWATKRLQGDLHVTSFYASTPPGSPWLKEYFRFVNVSGRTIDLKNYLVENCATGERVPLPSVSIPAGVQAQAYSETKKVVLDYESGNPLVVSLNRGADFWANAGAKVLLRDAQGRIHDAISSNQKFSCTPKPWSK